MSIVTIAKARIEVISDINQWFILSNIWYTIILTLGNLNVSEWVADSYEENIFKSRKLRSDPFIFNKNKYRLKS